MPEPLSGLEGSVGMLDFVIKLVTSSLDWFSSLSEGVSFFVIVLVLLLALIYVIIREMSKKTE